MILFWVHRRELRYKFLKNLWVLSFCPALQLLFIYRNCLSWWLGYLNAKGFKNAISVGKLFCSSITLSKYFSSVFFIPSLCSLSSPNLLSLITFSIAFWAFFQLTIFFPQFDFRAFLFFNVCLFYFQLACSTLVFLSWAFSRYCHYF